MSTPDFPDNAVDALVAALEAGVNFEGGVVRRPLRPNDPNFMAGVVASMWSPEEWAIGQYDPAITRYSLQIQTLVRSADEEEGIALHSRLAKRVRVMLYRNEELRLQLGRLSTTEAGVTERTLRWGVSGQRFLSNEVNGSYLYLAVTDVWYDTEIV